MQVTATIVGTGPVVMIDDDEGDVLIARRCYEQSRLTNPFVALLGGRRGYAYFQDVLAGKAEMPALGLVDINMPDMDGFTLVATVRQHPEFAEVPLVTMLTHSSNPTDITRSEEAGANALQTKPLTPDEYVAFFNALAG